MILKLNFNADLLPDIFLALGNEQSDYAQIDALNILTILIDTPALAETQFSFETADSIYINIYLRDGIFHLYTIHYVSTTLYEQSGPLTIAAHLEDAEAQII